MRPTILFVDENLSYVEALPSKVRRKFDLQAVDSYGAAQARLARGGEVAVVVVDLDVRGEDGIVFLSNARLTSPDTVRIVYSSRTRFADALNALNTARVFRYVRKPCPSGEMARFLVRAVQYHTERLKEQQALRKSLVGSIKALVDILNLVNPEAMSRSRRIWKRVMETGRALHVRPLWRLELAVTLSHLGCVAIPQEILEKLSLGEDLEPEEQQIFGMHPRIAANLLDNIDQMGPVAEIVRRQRMALHKEQPIEARIIKAAQDLDSLEQKGASAEDILEHMREQKDVYDQGVIDALFRIQAMHAASGVLQLGVGELEEGMVMAADLVNAEETRLLLRGQVLTGVSLSRLKAFAGDLKVVEPILVEAPAPAGNG